MLQIPLCYITMSSVCNKNVNICSVLSLPLTKRKEDGSMSIKQMMRTHALQSFPSSVVGNCAKQEMLHCLARASVYRRQEQQGCCSQATLAVREQANKPTRTRTSCWRKCEGWPRSGSQAFKVPRFWRVGLSSKRISQHQSVGGNATMCASGCCKQ